MPTLLVDFFCCPVETGSISGVGWGPPDRRGASCATGKVWGQEGNPSSLVCGCRPNHTGRRPWGSALFLTFK